MVPNYVIDLPYHCENGFHFSGRVVLERRLKMPEIEAQEGGHPRGTLSLRRRMAE
jgi:hypothetical protein